mmetsp:Transcript_4778/g.8194  ORF Transcript_4778/g.8194 Transcript_4778/m.8194 type:complete len:113 (+) Transcript_4778:10-348(+)
MEFDILNELLTSSVAQLFTDNQLQHHAMIKNSTQMGQDSNIPRHQGSGYKDSQGNHMMQTPEKDAGIYAQRQNELMRAGGPSPSGEKLQQLLSGGAPQFQDPNKMLSRDFKE